ncbi:MAG: hypothetical protein KAV42_03390 [Candidatus Krumholzibacteria bacterium]|nr:hypothetical protein [Candidatus Krumholzibacteria bacterium]
MKRIYRGVIFFFLPVMAAVIAVCSLSVAVMAGDPGQADYNFSDYMVNADPGEDPHLKIDPGTSEFTLYDIRTESAPPASSGSGQDAMLRGQDRAEMTTGRWYSRVNPKFRMVIMMISLTLTR